MRKKQQASHQEKLVQGAAKTLQEVRRVMPRERGHPFIQSGGNEEGNRRVDPGNQLKKKGKGWPNYPGNDWGAYSGFGERPAVYWD